MSRIYISGKITGLDPDQAVANFQRAESYLRDLGFDTFNPMSKANEQKELSWREYMAEDIKVLVDCDVIYLQQNWTESKGARLEWQIARELGLTTIYEQVIDGEALKVIEGMGRISIYRCDDCDAGWHTIEAADGCCRPSAVAA